MKNKINFEELYLDLQIKYSLPNKNAAEFLISKSIAQAYQAHDPIVLYENDGAIVYYKNNHGQLKGVKKTFSKKIKSEILKLIESNGIRMFLNLQKERIWQSIKEKKPYLHAIFSYTKNNYDYYDLYFDKKFNRPVLKAKCILKHTSIKKKRLFIDKQNFKFIKDEIIFKELEKIKTIKNFKYLTKEINHELVKLNNKKIYIEVVTFNFKKNQLFLRLPYKATRQEIEYIRTRYKEIFIVDTIFLKSS